MGAVYRFWNSFSGKASRIVVESLDETDPRPFLAFAKVTVTHDSDLIGASVVLAPRDGFVSGPPAYIDVVGSYSGPNGAEKYDFSRIYPDGDINETLGKEPATLRRKWSDFVLTMRGLRYLLTAPEIRASMRRIEEGFPKGTKRGDGSDFSTAVNDLILIWKVVEAESKRGAGSVYRFSLGPESEDWEKLVEKFPKLPDAANRSWAYIIFGPHENTSWTELREAWSDMALASAKVGDYWITVGALGIIHWDNATSRRAGTILIDESDEIAAAYYERNRR